MQINLNEKYHLVKFLERINCNQEIREVAKAFLFTQVDSLRVLFTTSGFTRTLDFWNKSFNLATALAISHRLARSLVYRSSVFGRAQLRSSF